ncbi:hypothetical protein [Flavobacterium sp. 5]|uniref:hypothetical protein n=1 Tax=Flavobacterium sp. 5 TaxID=2035199 RepID=UPI000CBA152A|nr:hypothetical protein [Flavobacterium sp. 5]PKB18387.1 hypothetical protein CLU82_3662 [Flavobacterium sp. 5]
MKKSVLQFCKILLIISAMFFASVSCKSSIATPLQEPIVIHHDTKNTNTEKETINQPINNNTVIPVIASNTNNSVFDSLVNSKVDEILNKLNYKNQSGDNSLEVKYNALLKELQILSKIGKTSSKATSKNDKETIEVPVIKQVPYPVIQPLTKLQKLLIALGVGFAGFYTIKYGLKLVSIVKGSTLWG